MGGIKFLMCFAVLYNTCQFTLSKKSSWAITIDQNSKESYTIFPNTMFKGSYISVYMLCSANAANAKVRVSWVLEELHCMDQLYETEQTGMVTKELNHINYEMLAHTRRVTVPERVTAPEIAPERIIRDNGPQQDTPASVELGATTDTDSDIVTIQFMMSEPEEFECSKNNLISLRDDSDRPYYVGYIRPHFLMDDPNRFTWKEQTSEWNREEKNTDNIVARTWESGIYHFGLKVEPVDDSLEFNTTVIVQMKSKGGFLPAIEWPLLPVRGVMAFLYLLIGSMWIFIWARSHQHTLKIHMVIGAVAVAGALANTVSFVELSSENSTGIGVSVLHWLGMFLTVLQGGLMQLLIMVVSTGYGITRPVLHKNLIGAAICLAAFFSLTCFFYGLSVDEEFKIKYSYPRIVMGIAATFFLLSIVIAGWMMIFAMMTFMHLCKRQHSQTKVIGFSVFAGTCTLTFLVNLALGLVSLGISKGCSRDWHMEWLSDSYTSMTAFVLMVVLMWLWRPMDEAQSYSFTPLNTDELRKEPGEYEDEGDEDDTIYDKGSLRIMDA